jgi:hypothetical protein
MDNQHAFYIFNSNSIISFTGPTLELAGESKFTTLGDKLIASSLFDNDLLFFSLNHGILRAKDTSLRLSMGGGGGVTGEESIHLMRFDSPGDLSFNPAQLRLNQTGMNHTLNDMLNMSPGAQQNLSTLDSDVSFSVKAAAARQSFDFTFNNLAAADQLTLNRLKEAFQFYLKKDEVNFNPNTINLNMSKKLECF